MAGNGSRNGPNPAYFWTRLDHTMLEYALVLHPEETADRWVMVARAMGAGRTEAEVRAQYQYLVESGRMVPPGPEGDVDVVQAPAPAQASGSASGSSSDSASTSDNGTA